jgi:uncharacterized protein with NRDE domain
VCLVALALHQHPRFPLVLASNRDEFFERPTAPMGWWPAEGDAPRLLAGRDLQGGGTWLGLGAQGRLALVTNVRDASLQRVDAPSRGALVPAWLASDEAFEPHWERLDASRYSGFNLIAADVTRDDWFWAGSRGAPHRIGPGVHGVSNARLDTPWPKVVRLKQALAEALQPDALATDDLEGLTRSLFDALGDRRPAPDASLPATGVPLALERELSPAFIHTHDGRYGTRCSTLVITQRPQAPATASTTWVIERRYDDQGAVLDERRFALEGWSA